MRGYVQRLLQPVAADATLLSPAEAQDRWKTALEAP